MKRIFITGGHFTPALAVIEELRRRGGWEIFYVGRKEAMEGDSALALEYQELFGRPDIHYLVITAGRLQANFFVRVGQSLKAILKTPIGFFQAFFWLLRFRPTVILSFGSYLALPVVVAGWVLGVPSVTHEQTVVPGRANRLISHLAKKVLVSWKEDGRAVYTGNPIREEFRKVTSARSKELKNILVTGGSQGAHRINVVVGEILVELVRKYRVVHQTGDSARFRDYETLAKFEQPRYQVKKFIKPADLAFSLAQIDLVISRAGANTVMELAALGKVAILIPLGGTGDNEQFRNAEKLANFGGAIILSENNLSGQKLLETISEIEGNWKIYQEKADRAKELVVWDAAKRIVDEVEKI